MLSRQRLPSGDDGFSCNNLGTFFLGPKMEEVQNDELGNHNDR